MKSITNLTLIITLLIVFLFSACKQTGENTTSHEKGGKLSAEEIKKGVEKIVFPLPEPVGVYQMLEEIGATYNSNVLNSPESIEKYYTSYVKAVNLGVYAADLSYATVYEKQGDVDTYARLLKKLVDDLGIKIDLKSLNNEETREKALNLDSLINITTGVFYNTYDFLYKESDPALAALMANGFYIEGLYIATHISKETFDNLEIVKIIYEQSKPLGELIKLNDKFPDNQYLQTVQGALKKLKTLYDESDGSLNKEQLDSITSTIENIRDSLIS